MQQRALEVNVGSQILRNDNEAPDGGTNVIAGFKLEVTGLEPGSVQCRVQDAPDSRYIGESISVPRKFLSTRYFSSVPR
jgi:hypothetical protein